MTSIISNTGITTLTIICNITNITQEPSGKIRTSASLPLCLPKTTISASQLAIVPQLLSLVYTIHLLIKYQFFHCANQNILAAYGT